MITILMAAWLQAAAAPGMAILPQASACLKLDQAFDGLNNWRTRWRAGTLDPGPDRATFAAEQLEKDPHVSALSSAVAEGLRNEARRMVRQDARETRLAEDRQVLLGDLLIARLTLCAGVSRPEGR